MKLSRLVGIVSSLILVAVLLSVSNSAGAGVVWKLYLPMVVSSKVYGLNFGPYIDGQDPTNAAVILPESQIRTRMAMIAPYTNWVRTFECGHGLEVAGRLAHEMGLKIAMGAWIGKSDADNQVQIRCLIEQANAGNVDIAIVGSEALLRGDVSRETLIGYIQQAQQAVTADIPITTADTYPNFLNNPTLISEIDLIFANIYPYWEGYPAEDAVAMVNKYYTDLTTAYPDTPVYISESGWPSCGESIDAATGSLATASSVFNQLETWARDRNVALFYFEAFDESWKATEEGPSGACWGIWNKTGTLKPGMQQVFDGVRTPYSTELPYTCNTTTQSFQFTYQPPLGSDNNVKGQVCGIHNWEKRIVMWILVNESWWIKPTDNAPFTLIAPSGNWETDYTTGGVDQEATRICAFLVPPNPPSVMYDYLWQNPDLYPRVCYDR